MEIGEMQNWKNIIRKEALELGFIAAGFTNAEPIYGLEALLEARTEFSTPFEEKNLKQRIDPKEVWPACKSVVAFAYPLAQGIPAEEINGRFARSAVGEDYHVVLKRLLIKLELKMKESGWNYANPVFQIDTGPLIERAFAVRAGLGFIGKNQNLIVPGYGSFVALCLMLLDQELPSDKSCDINCGACTKCIKACPVGIIGKEMFKPNKCLSYLTQSKAELSSQEELLMDTRIFGCDTCQEVCPHNYKQDSDKEGPGHNLGVDLEELLYLDSKNFNLKYKNTAAGWRGRALLQRNAVIAAKNLNDVRLEKWVNEMKNKKSISPLLWKYLDHKD